jgi:hypothetical protein
VTERVAIAGQPMLHPSYVEADLNYLAPMTERPRNYTFDPPPGVPRSNVVHEIRRMRIYSVRGFEQDVSLDRESFAVLRRASAVTDFYNEDAIHNIKLKTLVFHAA